MGYSSSEDENDTMEASGSVQNTPRAKVGRKRKAPSPSKHSQAVWNDTDSGGEREDEVVDGLEGWDEDWESGELSERMESEELSEMEGDKDDDDDDVGVEEGVVEPRPLHVTSYKNKVCGKVCCLSVFVGTVYVDGLVTSNIGNDT